jgi:DNA ligase-1
VRPELVVEIRFNDVQRSPRYPGGIALRFARVVRYREDKPAAEAELLASLVARVPGGGGDVEASEKSRKKKAREEARKRQLSFFDD